MFPFLSLALAVAPQAPQVHGASGPPGALPTPARAQAPDRAGLFWGDFDADGFEDVYAFDRDGAGRLFRNRGDGSFDDLTPTSGLPLTAAEPVERDGFPSAASWRDFDADGALDLLLVRGGRLQLFRQVGAASFAPVSVGVEHARDVHSVRWIDYDRDRTADLLVLRDAADDLFRGSPTEGFQRVRFTPDSGDERHAGVPSSGVSGTGSPLPNMTSAGPTQPPPRICADDVRDAAAPNTCLEASSAPTEGKLFPLSLELFVRAGTGFVGVGTLLPDERLDVVGGNIRTDGQLISSAASGAPLAVSSSDLVANLNADRLDGFEAADFSQLGATIETGELADAAVDGAKLAAGSVSDLHVQVGAAIAGAKIVPAFVGTTTTSGDLGVGTVAPAADLHVVGDASLARGWITPDAPTEGGSAELLLAEDRDGSAGFKLRYDGASDQLELRARSADADAASAALVVQRSSGNLAVGSSSTTLGRLTVDGSADNAVHAVRVLGGNGPGLRADTSRPGGVAVHGEGQSSSATGVLGVSEFYGVRGETASSAVAGAGVYGRSTPTSGTTYGVLGESASTSGTGVFGQVTSGSGLTNGVLGSTSSSAGRGVSGIALANSGLNYGVRGFSASASGFGVFASGDLGASGTKSFVQPHPEDPGLEVRFVCLEGNESGTYFRGSAQLVGGEARIEVPEEFRWVSEAEGLTVQVSPTSGAAALWIEAKSLEEIVVKGQPDVSFDYFVNGVRRGFDQLDLVRPNGSFVPTRAGVPFGTQYPEGLRRILIENGTLNPDATPNAATAARMGWKLE